jgi:hypothetical protein
VRQQSGGGGLCLIADWQLNAPPAAPEYVADLTLANPFGWDLATADAAIRDDQQQRIEDWRVGDQGSAFIFLAPPPGTPQGEYQAQLGLYLPAQDRLIDVLDQTGRWAGITLRLSLTLPHNTPLLGEASLPALIRDNSRNGSIEGGQDLQIELLLDNSQDQPLTLNLENGENITITLPPTRGLIWLALPLPLEFEGRATLTLGDQTLAEYEMILIERDYTPPPFTYTLNLIFPGVGNLIGLNLDQTRVQRDQPLRLDLIWQATAQPQIDYYVFVQLLDENGRLIGQGGDTPPLQGSRPTSGWLPNEYLLDSHQVHLLDLEYKGKAFLIVGLYNPLNGQRVLLADGADYAKIPIEIVVD